MYLGLQEQLYEPWVLLQEAFGWQLFIFAAWASLHSSMSERENTYYIKIKLHEMFSNEENKSTSSTQVLVG